MTAFPCYRSAWTIRKGGLTELFRPTGGPTHFALRVPLGDLLAAVVHFPTTGERNLHLGPSVLKEHLEGDNGEWLGGGLFPYLIDFVAVGKQLLLSVGVVRSKTDGEPPGRNMSLKEPELPIVHASVGVGNLRLPFAQTLDFTPDEHEATLEGVDDLVIVAGPSVGGDDLVTGTGRSSGGSFFNLSLRPGHTLRLEPKEDLLASIGWCSNLRLTNVTR